MLERLVGLGSVVERTRRVVYPGRKPSEYEIADWSIVDPMSTDNSDVHAARQRFDDAVYNHDSIRHTPVPRSVASRSVAHSRLARHIDTRNGYASQMESLRDAHERHPVPGYIVRLREMGERIRELDIRIDELGTLIDQS